MGDISSDYIEWNDGVINSKKSDSQTDSQQSDSGTSGIFKSSRKTSSSRKTTSNSPVSKSIHDLRISGNQFLVKIDNRLEKPDEKKVIKRIITALDLATEELHMSM